MAFCGPNHHGGSAATTAQQPGPAEHSNHHGDGQSAPGHHEMAALADEADSASASPETASQGSHAAKQKCSACASCCSLGAILSSLLAVPMPVFTPTVFSTAVPSVDIFAADGPDRPPRFVFA